MTITRKHVMQAALVATVVLCGLSAGFFYTYADSVTDGLAATGDAAYVETFQAINENVRSPLFMVVFAGPLAGLVVSAAFLRRSRTTTALLMVAALGYAVGVIAVTVAGSLPLNETLAGRTDPSAHTDARADFEDRWNRLNLVRAVTSCAVFVMTTVAMSLSGGRSRV
jgi:uncharacterized membrane protein